MTHNRLCNCEDTMSGKISPTVGEGLWFIVRDCRSDVCHQHILANHYKLIENQMLLTENVMQRRINQYQWSVSIRNSDTEQKLTRTEVAGDRTANDLVEAQPDTTKMTVVTNGPRTASRVNREQRSSRIIMWLTFSPSDRRHNITFVIAKVKETPSLHH